MTKTTATKERSGTLLNREMDRRTFVLYLATAALAFTGIAAVLVALTRAGILPPKRQLTPHLANYGAKKSA